MFTEGFVDAACVFLSLIREMETVTQAAVVWFVGMNVIARGDASGVAVCCDLSDCDKTMSPTGRSAISVPLVVDSVLFRCHALARKLTSFFRNVTIIF